MDKFMQDAESSEVTVRQQTLLLGLGMEFVMKNNATIMKTLDTLSRQNVSLNKQVLHLSKALEETKKVRGIVFKLKIEILEHYKIFKGYIWKMYFLFFSFFRVWFENI